MGFFSNKYEIKDDIRTNCTDEQRRLIETFGEFNDDMDSLSIDSIKAILPDRFSDVFDMNVEDEDDIKYMKLMFKFCKMWKEFIDLSRSFNVVIAEQCAQINDMEKELHKLNEKLDSIERDIKMEKGKLK